MEFEYSKFSIIKDFSFGQFHFNMIFEEAKDLFYACRDNSDRAAIFEKLANFLEDLL